MNRPMALPPAITRPPKPTVPPQESLALLEQALAAGVKLADMDEGASREDAVCKGTEQTPDIPPTDPKSTLIDPKSTLIDPNRPSYTRIVPHIP